MGGGGGGGVVWLRYGPAAPPLFSVELLATFHKIAINIGEL